MAQRATYSLGPLSAVSGSTWEKWLARAKAGDALVYAFGGELDQGSVAVIAAREAAAGGLVLLTQKRRGTPPGGFEWIATRKAERVAPVAAARPGAAGEMLSAQAADVLTLFRRAARFGQVAPTNSEIAEALGLKDKQAARYLVSKLIDARLIEVVDLGPRKRRIVTIVGTGYSTVPGVV